MDYYDHTNENQFQNNKNFALSRQELEQMSKDIPDSPERKMFNRVVLGNEMLLEEQHHYKMLKEENKRIALQHEKVLLDMKVNLDILRIVREEMRIIKRSNMSKKDLMGRIHCIATHVEGANY